MQQAEDRLPGAADQWAQTQLVQTSVTNFMRVAAAALRWCERSAHAQNPALELRQAPLGQGQGRIEIIP